MATSTDYVCYIVIRGYSFAKQYHHAGRDVTTWSQLHCHERCLTIRTDCFIYVVVPPEGTPVPSNIAKRAGPYLLGPTLGSSPVKSIVQCLARLEGSDEFYTLKVIATANYIILV